MVVGLEVAELFWGVTLPLVITFLGIFAALVVMYLSERGRLGKIADGIEEIGRSVSDIKHEVKGLRELTDYLKGLKANLLEPIISEISKHGVTGYLRSILGRTKERANPLTPEEAELRKELMEKGMRAGLNREEAKRLREILNKEAKEALAEGIVGFLGFLALLSLIGLIVTSLSRGEGSDQA